MAVQIGQEGRERPLEDFLHDFQSHLLAACEGKAGEGDGNYRTFRSALLLDERLAPLVPSYIKRNRTADALWSFFKSYNPQWEPRRQMIRAEFEPLFEVAEGRRLVPAHSANWTGKRTFQQRVAIARKLAPAAMRGVDQLLELEFSSLHNGGPVDDDRAEALAALRALHSALGELLDAEPSERSFAGSLARLKGLAHATFKWSRDSYELIVAGLPLSTATTAVGAGVMTVVSAITKDVAMSVAVGTLAGTATMQAGKGKQK